VPSGGQKLANGALQEKALEGPVTLLAFCNEHDRAYREEEAFAFCSEVGVFSLSQGSRWWAALRHPGMPLTASVRYLAAARWLEDRTRVSRFREVWIEFIQGAAVLDLLPTDVSTTVVVHDLLHQALERRAAAAPPGIRRLLQWEAARTRRWESRVLRRATRILTLNEKDRNLIVQISGRTDVEVRYPTVDECFRQVSRDPSGIERDTILFWGHMSRMENVDAALWFAGSILPRIQRIRPAARLLIAGAAPAPEVVSLAGGNVEVLGFVEDPVRLFSRVSLGVAPLRLGSGIKIKVIEYLAARIPTVATPVGAEGVRPSPYLNVAETEEEFAACCCVWLNQAAGQPEKPSASASS
jgi:glycosyltransferase involved in cell wall biosynthesis